jgi:hypothetical protein
MKKAAAVLTLSLTAFMVVPASAHAEDCDVPGLSVTVDDGGTPNTDCGGGGMDNSGEDWSSDPGAPPAGADNLGDTIVGPNWDNPDAYTTIGLIEVPNSTATLDADGMPYTADQARALDQAVDDAIRDGSYGHYTIGTWVPYPGDQAYDGFRNWVSDILGWYPACIPYSGVKATGGLAVPDGALCLSNWHD